jgi:hypothetical protein
MTPPQATSGGGPEAIFHRVDAPGCLLLEKTEGQVLGEFFVAAAAFYEGRDGESGANTVLPPSAAGAQESPIRGSQSPIPR